MALYLADLDEHLQEHTTSLGLPDDLRRQILSRGVSGLDRRTLLWLVYDVEALAELHIEIIDSEHCADSYWGRMRRNLEPRERSPLALPPRPAERSFRERDLPIACAMPFEPVANGYTFCKTVLDLLLAGVMFVLFAPLLMLMAFLIKLTSPGPALYRQTRVGRNGRQFCIYKLRTMTVDCERGSGPQWSLDPDPRITPLGRYLRCSHIDELPQLWNVLCGEMSLVGPRPERPEFVHMLEPALPYYRERLRVRPGITGLAQLQLPSDTDLESVRRKLACDLYYVRHANLWLDVRILLSTVIYFILGLITPLLPRPIGLLDFVAMISRKFLRIPGGETVQRTYREAASSHLQADQPSMWVMAV